MASRTPLYCIVPLEDGFQVRLTLPLGLRPDEAHRLKVLINENTTDLSESAKYLVSDPNVSPEITL